MTNPFTRLTHLVTQMLFSVITPPLLVPAIARQSITRLFVSFCFGRAYGNGYQKVIDCFKGRYGAAMAEGLAKAKEVAENGISVVVDCGTGTGFVARQAAEYFPDAMLIAYDCLYRMLMQARRGCKHLNTDVQHLQADTFALPLADQSVDLLLVQNTIPCFSEFARVCRPGGMVLYVDTSAGWIVDLVKRLVERHGLFKTVTGERVDLGFYALIR
ncbi:MAG: class I SAM-dependent methyltransferase [Thermodesulfobacteriota bacterium]|nr:class I SAM-dependent methyltransferase [Thermodesulfobacteriota bacterium]